MSKPYTKTDYRDLCTENAALRAIIAAYEGGAFHDQLVASAQEVERLNAQLATVTTERDLFRASMQERLADYGEACDRERALKQQLLASHQACERLENVLKGDALVEHLAFTAGQPMELHLSHPIQASMIAGFADLLNQSHAENYLEIQMSDREGHRYICTVQRAEKPTPHELRRKAEAELEALRHSQARLRWTKEKPIEAGWYWYDSGLDEGPEVVRVRPSRNAGEGLIAVNELEYDLVEQMEGLWSRPIPAPGAGAGEEGG